MNFPPLPELTEFEMLMIELQLPLIDGMPCVCTVHLLHIDSGEAHSVAVNAEDPGEAYKHALHFVRAKDLAYRRRKEQTANPSSGSLFGALGNEEPLQGGNPDEEIPF